MVRLSKRWLEFSPPAIMALQWATPSGAFSHHHCLVLWSSRVSRACVHQLAPQWFLGYFYSFLLFFFAPPRYPCASHRVHRVCAFPRVEKPLQPLTVLLWAGDSDDNTPWHRLSCAKRAKGGCWVQFLYRRNSIEWVQPPGLLPPVSSV